MNEEQRAICKKYGSVCIEIKDDEILGVALDTLGNEPLYGVRMMPMDKTIGWYIWGGPYSDDAHFYQPTHLSHVRKLCPAVIKYLCLEPGFKFIIDRSGYEDVWREAL